MQISAKRSHALEKEDILLKNIMSRNFVNSDFKMIGWELLCPPPFFLTL